MSQFHLDRGSRELYIGDGGELRQTLPQSSSPVGSQTSTNSPQYKMGTPTYRSGVYVERDNTRPPRPAATFIRAVDPAYASPQRTHVTYRLHQENYSTSPGSDSPPPPPYSPPRHSPSPTRGQGYIEVRRNISPSRIYAAMYRTESADLPRESAATYQNLPLRQRSPSPVFQERKDIETLVPTYTAAYPSNERLPTGAPSKIVYSTHIPPQGQGQVSSKPMSERDEIDMLRSEPQPSVPSSITYKPTENSYGHSPAFRPGTRPDPSAASPRPYQLKPTMDSYSEDSSSVKKPVGVGKEAEVDALTSLLIQNMEVSGDPDFFGQCSLCGKAVFGHDKACQAMDNIYHVHCFVCAKCGMCVKCGRAIMGDNLGCSALDQLFHIECFTCATCGMCLKGHQFFAMEGKPYCEPCYMNTLEKCSVCSIPITDRILRATGKPYHPTCFTCVVCGKSLDGIQFTVDATNQIHCLEDFHKKFAPRCCVCDGPIMPDSGEEETVRIVAMDRSFHVKCYKCEDCGMRLSSEADGRGCYPLDDHILCKQCNARRIQAMTTRMMTEL